MKRTAPNPLLLLLTAAILTLAASCARMGQPDGGWYDDTPPRILHASPAEKATGVKQKKVSIYFDEFIKLEDASNKVVVSPPQLEMPEIRAAGKKIVVELKDTLKENTTYTIDFADAITDNNEGNPMGNYTYSFSTGGRIDSFEVAGTVLDASNLEPVKGILVGLYDDHSDSAFTTQPLLRVSRTDGRGRFVIRGVAPGEYRAYALKDADGDFKYSQKSEMVAFSSRIISPRCAPDIRQDTIWRDSLRIDSIIRTGYTHFYPDDVVLRAFTQEQTDRYLLKTDRSDHRKFTLFFTYGNDSLPAIRGLNFDEKGAFFLENSEKNDTLCYWLRDTALVNRDSLEMELTYLMTDSTGAIVSRTDTITALPKTSYEKREKERLKEIEKWQKKMEKAKKKGQPYDSIMPIKHLEMKMSGSSLDPDRNVLIESPTPLASIDTAAIHLYIKQDSLWIDTPHKWRRKKGTLRQYELLAEWLPANEYKMEIDSAAIEDIYGTISGPIKMGIRVKDLEEYSTLAVAVSGCDSIADSTLVVQLLNSNDAVVKEARVKDGEADFFYLNPGKYYIRAFADLNGNGVWDTGNYAQGLQPEPLFYDPREVECKAKWDITHAWNISGRPLDRQKPSAITKQKPDKEKKLRNRNADRAAKLGITYRP